MGPASQFQWEKRAQEARRMAATMKHPTRKREMLLIASAYDKLAEHTREVSLLRRQHWIHYGLDGRMVEREGTTTKLRPSH
jgi:hypothetical protein